MWICGQFCAWHNSSKWILDGFCFGKRGEKQIKSCQFYILDAKLNAAEAEHDRELQLLIKTCVDFLSVVYRHLPKLLGYPRSKKLQVLCIVSWLLYLNVAITVGNFVFCKVYAPNLFFSERASKIYVGTNSVFLWSWYKKRRIQVLHIV